MLTLIQSIRGYFASKKEDKENATLEEITRKLQESVLEEEVQENAHQSENFEEGCFYRTGIITSVTDKHIVIDNRYTCDKLNVKVPIDEILNKKVNYMAFQLDEDKEIKIRSVMSINEDNWDSGDYVERENKAREEFYDEENDVTGKSKLMTRNVIGQVVKRDGRRVCIGVSSEEIWFNLNEVESKFIPLIGDWLNATAYTSVDNEVDDMCGEVLQIKAISPLRMQMHTGKIADYNPVTKVGNVDNMYVFSKGAFQTGYIPCVKDMVACEAIESSQGIFKWRCLNLVPLNEKNDKGIHSGFSATGMQLPADIKELLEDKDGIAISKVTGVVLEVNEEKTFNIIVKNLGHMTQMINRSYFRSNKAQSQLTLLSPKMNEPIVLGMSDSITYTFKCTARYVGTSEEIFEFCFKHFKMARIFTITVKAKGHSKIQSEPSEERREKKNIMARYDEYDEETYIPGIKPIRAAAFAVRTSVFRIPKEFWNIVLTLLNEKKYSSERELGLRNAMPFFEDDLTFGNYERKFHALLYLEEIENIVNLQRYDIESVCMRKSGEYLTIEVQGLAEKRPSLIRGDKAIVSLKFDETGTKYEGFIHKVKHNEIFLKFNQKFFESYNSEDCSVTFKASSAVIQRCHQAVKHAVSFLGQQFLFPTKVFENEPQYILQEVDEDPETNGEEILESKDKEEALNENVAEKYKKFFKTRKLEWFNKRLNIYQKAAVKNILMGIARPLPYVIFGPPGTGKTITLCEAVLQIFTVIPHSRILIATPANSSANLIAERLIDSNLFQPGNLVRLLSFNYLEDGDIPEKLLPYCAVGNLRSVNSTKRDKYADEDDKRSLTAKVLGRHRITIGTCSTLGLLYNMGFPRGHFTHIVVDEAGQATEPEIMVPMTFVHSDSGQIILAGDPMQLGPMVMSKLALYYGLGESFLFRLLQQFPYQKDPEGFPDTGGYDPRLVTKLLMNYRSLPEILSLPNFLFYDSELLPQVSAEESKEAKFLLSLEDILPPRDNFPPAIVFHGVIGTNFQDTESPSWYNQEEATQVYLYFFKLMEKGVSPNDIGIITPYRKQVSQIRDLLADFDTEIPKVASVEEFQGQERKVIILSTVRSSKGLITQDVKHALGFVATPERLNVAITRARALLIIIGNPSLLSHDHCWRSVIDYCYIRKACTGCNLTSDATDEDYGNDKESFNFYA